MERDSFDEISSEEMLVMAADNINIEEENSGEEEEPTKTLVVTNVDSEVFVDELIKSEFEAEFLAFDKTAAFYYIRWGDWLVGHCHTCDLYFSLSERSDESG